MKKDLKRSIPKLELRNGTYEGGFGTISSEQLLKMKGGTHSNCTNSGICTGGDNTICTNTGTCYVPVTPGGNF